MCPSNQTVCVEQVHQLHQLDDRLARTTIALDALAIWRNWTNHLIQASREARYYLCDFISDTTTWRLEVCDIEKCRYRGITISDSTIYTVSRKRYKQHFTLYITLRDSNASLSFLASSAVRSESNRKTSTYGADMSLCNTKCSLYYCIATRKRTNAGRQLWPSISPDLKPVDYSVW